MDSNHLLTLCQESLNALFLFSCCILWKINPKDIMDTVERIVNICKAIYQMDQNTKANKERCQRVINRVRALEELVLTIKQRGPGQISATVSKALSELCITLISAQELINKYSKTKPVKSFLKSGSHEEQFSKMNEKLTDNFQVLSGALQIEHGNILHKVYESVQRQDVVQPLTSPTSLMPFPMPVSSSTAPYPLPMPMPSPTAQMPLPMPVSSPTTPMVSPMPTAPMPLPMPVSSPTALMPLSMPAYRPTNPTSVHCVVSPRPVSVPTATMPVRCVMSPMQVSRPMNTTVVAQCAPGMMSSIMISPTTAPVAMMPFNRPVAPMNYSPQTSSVVTVVRPFLR